MRKLILASPLLLAGCGFIMDYNLAEAYQKWCINDAPNWWVLSCEVEYVREDRNYLLSHGDRNNSDKKEKVSE